MARKTVPKNRALKNAEQFKVLNEDDAVEKWRRYLELQVILFAKSEFELLQRKGLFSSSSPVLDLGCGPGLYTRALRAWNPNVFVVAADTNLALLSEFESALQTQPDAGIKIIKWTAGTTTIPKEVRTCKTVILRYVLQHNHRPIKILKSLKKSLGRGSLICIIEEDDGLYQFDPPFPAFERVIKIWDTWAKSYKADRCVGRKIPMMAAKAGLEVVDLNVLAHTPYSSDIDLFLEYFKLSFDIVTATSPRILNASQSHELTKAFDQYARKYGKNCFLFYPQVMTIVRVP